MGEARAILHQVGRKPGEQEQAVVGHSPCCQSRYPIRCWDGLSSTAVLPCQVPSLIWIGIEVCSHAGPFLFSCSGASGTAGGAGRYVPPALRAAQQRGGGAASALERRITGLLNRYGKGSMSVHLLEHTQTHTNTPTSTPTPTYSYIHTCTHAHIYTV
jgi:hypothetical protein